MLSIRGLTVFGYNFHLFIFQGKISPSMQVLSKPMSSLKHVKLISLAAAKSLEDLTKAFPVVSFIHITLFSLSAS